MILSVSRRTDIPNYYSDWFLKRVQEGFLYVRNPVNAHQISKISLSPEVIDCIVFWSKNPENMIKRLDELEDYEYYFQFTLTGYGKDVEPNLPDKEHLVRVFQALAEKIGPERIVWRYDPIFWSDIYTTEYHEKAFQDLAEQLNGCTRKVMISFLDLYAAMKRRMHTFHLEPAREEDKVRELTARIAELAAQNGMKVETCIEQIDLQNIGISHGSCIDRKLMEGILGCGLGGAVDKTQRKMCRCMESIDVGTYDTCLNGCLYCYANTSEKKVENNRKNYGVDSPLLCGKIGSEDRITERKMKSLKIEEKLNKEWRKDQRIENALDQQLQEAQAQAQAEAAAQRARQQGDPDSFAEVRKGVYLKGVPAEALLSILP